MVDWFQRLMISYGSLLKEMHNYFTSARAVRERNFHISVVLWLAVYGEEHSCSCEQCVEGHDFQEIHRKVAL